MHIEPKVEVKPNKRNYENNINGFLNAKMVFESFIDNFATKSNVLISKYWCMKNSGKQFIPKNSMLVKVQGDLDV